MTLRTIKRLITGLAGLAVLFAGASLIAVPKAQALYCGGKKLPDGTWYATNISCGGPTRCGTLFVQDFSTQGIHDGYCLDNRPTFPVAEQGPAEEAR